jgi:hypothetical protein
LITEYPLIRAALIFSRCLVYFQDLSINKITPEILQRYPMSGHDSFLRKGLPVVQHNYWVKIRTVISDN